MRSYNRAATTVTVSLYLTLQGPEMEGHELDEPEVVVTGNVSAFVPGRKYGPPEVCYDDEGGEVEIVSSMLDGVAYELSAVDEERALDLLGEEAASNPVYEDDEPLDVDDCVDDYPEDRYDPGY